MEYEYRGFISSLISLQELVAPFSRAGATSRPTTGRRNPKVSTSLKFISPKPELAYVVQRTTPTRPGTTNSSVLWPPSRQNDPHFSFPLPFAPRTNSLPWRTPRNALDGPLPLQSQAEMLTKMKADLTTRTRVPRSPHRRPDVTPTAHYASRRPPSNVAQSGSVGRFRSRSSASHVRYHATYNERGFVGHLFTMGARVGLDWTSIFYVGSSWRGRCH